jgi:hypothetical protein
MGLYEVTCSECRRVATLTPREIESNCAARCPACGADLPLEDGAVTFVDLATLEGRFNDWLCEARTKRRADGTRRPSFPASSARTNGTREPMVTDDLMHRRWGSRLVMLPSTGSEGRGGDEGDPADPEGTTWSLIPPARRQ